MNSHALKSPARRGLIALLLALAAFASASGSARAAVQWNDGTAATSTLVHCVLGTFETGALAYAGYQADPNALPHAGDVFYGHAVFGAAMEACSGDQYGELDVVLPPGVSLAIDAAHPVYCFYEDNQGPVQPYSPCPTHAVGGTYGPQLPAGDGGGPWDMPAGRLIEVQFPLVSNRELKGPAGGHCPETVDELSAYPQHDCLITALHVADGFSDPWLLPNEELFISPGAAPPSAPAPGTPGSDSGSGTGSGGSSGVKAALKVTRHLKLSKLMSKGVTVRLTLPHAGSTVNMWLMMGHRKLAHLRRRHLRAGTLSFRLRLSRSARARVRHVRHARLTVIEKLTNPKATLRTSVLVKR
jgi:hypothetical protein